MKVNDFFYNLPEYLIAQTPLEERPSSRLLVVNRNNKQLIDDKFYSLLNYLTDNDVLVFNNTKVLQSRIYGRKVSTGASIEFLLLNEQKPFWQVLARPGRRLKPNDLVDFSGLMQAKIIDKQEEGKFLVSFIYQGIFLEILEKLGRVPLPPYIHEELKDESRYQTVYANHLGSAAAPTAGLHFDGKLLEKIAERNIERIFLTLHIGLGTFRPVNVDVVEEHKMHEEHYEITEEAAFALNNAIKKGKRIIAVGTTVTRVLESAINSNGIITAQKGSTNIFIYPGYNFSVVDALITNFHLPKSTLLMLVSAFYNRINILEVYEYAIKQEYRFFSFGDAMFII